MLKRLKLTNVGPAPEMEIAFGKRLTLITGDNGLGKSFLLDAAWWALTRQWPQDVNPKMTSGYMAQPYDRSKKAEIGFELTSKTKELAYTSRFSILDNAWVGKAGRPPNPGLVIYAHADGSFSVWDPARNYWKKKGNIDIQEKLPAYVFSPSEVWDGLKSKIDPRITVCNGLLSDWTGWIKEKGDLAKRMAVVLKNLSPSKKPQDWLTVEGYTRLSDDDSRDVPALKTLYAEKIPILQASSGVKKVVALAYILLWSWQEHRDAAIRRGEERVNQITILVDEIEAHLHPKWQRSILQAILSLTGKMYFQAEIQLIAATHSPLILASAEPLFDNKTDAWFDLDLKITGQDAVVQLQQRPFYRRGDVSKWLTSEAFDLKEARSKEAEIALIEARQLLLQESPSKEEILAVDKKLKGALSDTDAFWMRWANYRDRLIGEQA